jgi:hypothetical protein
MLNNNDNLTSAPVKMSKKIYALCVLLVVIAGVEGWIIYVEKDVRNIALGSYTYSDPGFDYIKIKGTWLSDSDLAYPVNTAEITCVKKTNTCTDSRAEISEDKFLFLSNTPYEIETWSNTEITTKPEVSLAGCTRYTMRIDRVQKQLTATRTTINTEGDCSITQKDPIHLHLGDGWDVKIKN